MATHLLESEGRRRCRSLGAMLPSIALHGALIIAAVHATAHAALRRTPNGPKVDTLVFTPPVIRRSADRIRRPRDSDAPPLASIAPIEVPTPSLSRLSFSLDSMSKPATTLVSHGDFREGLSTGLGGAMIRGVDDAVLDARSVDRQAEALSGTRPPTYPDVLRASGTQGAVVVQFVVDTAGRVERSSLRVTSSTNPLFSESVRNALAVARFRPAELGGAPVRQLVQQSFSFVLH